MHELNRLEQTYRQLKSQGQSVLQLFSGNPNEPDLYFPSEILQEAYQPLLKTIKYQPHPKGLRVAREAIARYYEKQNLSVDPENILITSGTSESFSHLFHYLAKPGENILAPRPSYPLFEHLAEYARIELRSYELSEKTDWAIDFESLESAVDNKTRALLLISPNNPTGSVASSSEIEQLVGFCQKRNLALISDEVFSEFYFGDSPFPRALSFQDLPLGFTLNGISKMFALPALKLSWMIVHGEHSRVLRAVDELETFNDTFLSCHTLIQEALPILFERGKNFLEFYPQEVKKRRDLAVDILSTSSNLKIIKPSGAFYLTATVLHSQGLSEEDWVIELMKEKKVMVHPGYFFDFEEGIHFVISYLAAQDILRIGLKAIVDFAGN